MPASSSASSLIRPASRHRPAFTARAGLATHRAWLASFATALFACTAPDRPAGLVPPLPPATLSRIAPDSVRALRLSDGVYYRFAWSARGPWAIHMLSADLGRCELGLRVVPAVDRNGTTRVRMSVTEMTPASVGAVLAGVNGDFFEPDGTPVGPEATAITKRFSTRPAFVWDHGQLPTIGPANMETGDSALDAMVAGGDERRSQEHPRQVVGGFPELLDAGQPVGDLGVAARPGFAAMRHPRTAVGVDTVAGLLWLVVVDGRQLPRSAGMSLPELTDLLQSLGVDEALNLDGGGSSAMAVRGRLISTPSDAEGERRVGNSLWLVRDPGDCQSG